MSRSLQVIAGLVATFAVLLGGCTSPGSNPSFALAVEDAQAAIGAMQERPTFPQRPIVVLGGIVDPGFAPDHIAARLHRVMDDPAIVKVAFPFQGSFEGCRRKVIAAVDEAFPSDDPVWTTEVDVVAVSMGGLVARCAAAPDPIDENKRRLRIARMFTIATPHRGADMATLPTLDRKQIDMRAGSPFLARLDAELAEAGYELVPYVRIGDEIVGARNAAPGDDVPWWVPNRPLEMAHMTAFSDPRIVADIMRRLRGEVPFTSDPPAPLPVEQ